MASERSVSSAVRYIGRLARRKGAAAGSMVKLR
jgi:hypothetical protein